MTIIIIAEPALGQLLRRQRDLAGPHVVVAQRAYVDNNNNNSNNNEYINDKVIT